MNYNVCRRQVDILAGRLAQPGDGCASYLNSDGIAAGPAWFLPGTRNKWVNRCGFAIIIRLSSGTGTPQGVVGMHNRQFTGNERTQ